MLQQYRDGQAQNQVVPPFQQPVPVQEPPMIDTSVVVQPQHSVESLARSFNQVSLAPKVSMVTSTSDPLVTVPTVVQKGKHTPLAKQYLNLPPAMTTRSKKYQKPEEDDEERPENYE